MYIHGPATYPVEGLFRKVMFNRNLRKDKFKVGTKEQEQSFDNFLNIFNQNERRRYFKRCFIFYFFYHQRR